MVKLEESINIPREGIFWVINNELVAFSDQVNPMDPFQTTDLLHKEVWKNIKDNYLVNGKEVDYDYFPRGRVEILVIQDDQKVVDYYDSHVYMDRCISNKTWMNKVIDEFRLYFNNVHVTFDGQLFIDGSHYVCNSCKRRNNK